MPRLEFFYDCSSPWTYLAFTRIQPLAADLGVPIEWKPILVGGVFNEVNKGVYAMRDQMFENERRFSYYLKDLEAWSELCGLRIGQPDFHPVNSVKAMRGCLFAAEHDKLTEFSALVFEAYWSDLRDISQDEVLRDICARCALDADALLADIATPERKAELRVNTDALVQRGGFGSPTMFVDETEMFFGNDRLPLVEHALKKRL